MTSILGSIEEAEFYTPVEVAVAVRLSKMTVYREIQRGNLPAIRIGRSFRILGKNVLQWIAEPPTE